MVAHLCWSGVIEAGILALLLLPSAIIGGGCDPHRLRMAQIRPSSSRMSGGFRRFAPENLSTGLTSAVHLAQPCGAAAANTARPLDVIGHLCRDRTYRARSVVRVRSIWFENDHRICRGPCV